MIPHPRLALDDVVLRSGTYRYAGCTRCAVWLVRGGPGRDLRVDLAAAGDATIVTSSVSPFEEPDAAMRWVEGIVPDVTWDDGATG